MNNPVIKDAVDFENRFFATDEMKRQYELSEKHRHDYISSIDYAHMQGKAEGRIEGRTEGRQEGIKENKVKNAINLLKLGIDVETISRGVDLSINEVEAIKKTLR